MSVSNINRTGRTSPPGRGNLGEAANAADDTVRTTRLAAQAIEAALEGRHAEPLLGVLEALAAGAPPARLEAAATALLAVGHRSGADALRGVVAVLARARGAPRW